ncbi:MAG: glycosyltransferase family 2 protein [Butyrivibrio sp.]|nr:glycosyltransferase family 2 protein [Butyrivibrio sp.]
MKLQSLLYPTKQICNEEALYLHREEGFIMFDGYFNLFYLEKYHKYCDISDLHLELMVKNVKRIILMHDRDVLYEVSNISDQESEVVLELPYDLYVNGVFWFKVELTDANRPWIVKGTYEGRVNESRDIKVAIGICTFKREKYVLRNLKSMMDYFENNPEIRALFHVFLVDNGSTLTGLEEYISLQNRAYEIGGNRLLTLIENKNNGGTGGFTRAMEEAISRKEDLGLTNLMLLDDDAVFDPEIFSRIVGFLKALKSEYEDITVGGAMWREDMPYMLYAFGEHHYKFSVESPAHMLDLREFDTCIRPEIVSPDTEKSLYSGWWCCTYSMKIITKDNLPMPLFIHFDDILFCRQHSEGRIALIPGIGVWHQGFELRFPGVNHYYNTRNQLITVAVMDEIRPIKVARWATKQLAAPLLTLRYEEMNLAYQGIKDFLKGPDWLDTIDGENLHLEIMNQYKRNVVMRPLREILPAEDYQKLKVEKLSEEARLTANMKFWKERKQGKSLKKIISLNGWLLPPDKKMGYYCNADSPWSLYKKGKVLLYEPEADRGYIETRKISKGIKCAGIIACSTVLLLVKYSLIERKYKIRANKEC